MVATAQRTDTRMLSIDGTTASVDAWRRALERAKAEGVKVWHLPPSPGGEPEQWVTSSSSHPGQRHHVNGRCDCEGARRGLLCKHVAAVVSARLALGQLVQCQLCGRVGEASRMHFEQRWVGGEGWRDGWYCGEGYGHQARTAWEARMAALDDGTAADIPTY